MDTNFVQRAHQIADEYAEGRDYMRVETLRIYEVARSLRLNLFEEEGNEGLSDDEFHAAQDEFIAELAAQLAAVTGTVEERNAYELAVMGDFEFIAG